jgi:hypothetical protein
VDWRIEDRYYVRIEEPKLNAWVVYNQWSRWSVAVFDRAAETTVLELEEADLGNAKRLVESYIKQTYGKDIAPDRWMEALTPRGGPEACHDVTLIGQGKTPSVRKTRTG